MALAVWRWARAKVVANPADSATGKCNSSSPVGGAANEVWFDDAKSLAPKYAVAESNNLRGIGVWEVCCVFTACR